MPPLLMDLGYSLLLLVGIVFACTVFTNAIEWLGKKMHLSEGIVGSVLAAVGTALPETLVPIVAIVSGLVAGTGISPEASHEIGVGAILGAPFMLTTLGMFVTAAGIFFARATKQRTLDLLIDKNLYLLEKKYFFLAFGLAIAATFAPLGPIRYGIAVALLGIYALYLKKLFSAPDTIDNEEEEHLHPLMINQLLGKAHVAPAMQAIVAQSILGVLGIIVMAHLFVQEVEHLSQVLNIAPLVLSLIIIPIATELPEKFNSVLWVQEEKDQLAIGNLTGAMVFQSCIPTAIGVAFTPWLLEGYAWLSVAVCAVSALVMSVGIKLLPQRLWVWLLLSGGVFYAFFVWAVLTGQRVTFG